MVVPYLLGLPSQPRRVIYNYAERARRTASFLARIATRATLLVCLPTRNSPRKGRVRAGNVRARTLTCRDRDVLRTRQSVRDTRPVCERCPGSTWMDDSPRVDGERCVHDSRCCARFFPRRRRRT